MTAEPTDAPAEPLRVVVVDDEQLLRDGLVTLLNLHTDIAVVGEANSCAEARAVIGRTAPDVVVMDITLPDGDGITVVGELAPQLPATRFVIITSHARPGQLPLALAAGAHAFVPKAISGRSLAGVLREVAAGQRYIDPRLAAHALAVGPNPLSARETEILRLVARGCAATTIAHETHLAAGTVRNMVSAVLAKVGATSRHEAVRVAQQHGWL